MRTVLVDSDNYRGAGVTTLMFPAGEPHVRIPDWHDANLIMTLHFRDSYDLLEAMLVLNAHQQQAPDRERIVFAPYMPGSRQDRSDGRTPLTGRMMAELLRKYATELHTFDLHSNAFRDLITHNWMPRDVVYKSYAPDLQFIAPDEGATERTQSLAMAWRNRVGGILQATKEREFETGNILKYDLPKLPRSATYLVVDDICDGGRTFNMLADEFSKDPLAQFSKLGLWVSHGIFSQGVKNVSECYETIYTTDSVYTGDDQRVMVVSLMPIVNQIRKELEERY